MQLRSLPPLAVVVTLLLSGCGGGGSAVDAVSKAAESQQCIGCHSGAVSPGTGVAIMAEWQGSMHARGNGAGCADCHEPAAGHPNVCSTCHGGGGSPTGYEVTRNPDSDGKCGKCHGLAHPSDRMVGAAPQHFGNMTASAANKTTRASYVSGQYVGNCRACHNPHDNTLTDQHRAYAESAHGDTRGVAWTATDFKANAVCIRCHTTTGFRGYVASNFTIPTSGFGAGDTSHEVLACNACHASYDFKKSIRQIPAVTAPYNSGQTIATFPDVGETNLCIPCHAGRENGDTINAIPDASFTNTGFKNGHYLAAAALMYMSTGFTSFTSPTAAIGTSTYGKSLSPDNLSVPGGVAGGVSSTHRKFGTPLINGDRHKPDFFVPGVFDKNGPCVTCHLNASGVPKRAASGHSLKIDATAYRQVCINCHTSEGGVPLAADGSDFRSAFLEPQAQDFQDALHLMEALLLRRYGISFDEASARFYDERRPLVNGKKQSVTDWTRGGTVNGRKLMGSCFNLHLLTREPAAYVHARTYVRRLIYDSIDFLDDGTMNRSTGATAVASGLTRADGTPVYVKDTTANGATTDAMLYLIGSNRTAGTWNAIERP